MTPRQLVAHELAHALLGGPATAEGFAARVALALGRKSRWIEPFAKRVFQRFGSRLSHAQRAALVEFIRNDRGYGDAWERKVPPRIHHRFLDPPPMAPRVGALAACALPSMPTAGDIAAWFAITPSQLDWYADLRGMIDDPDSPLCHYRYQWVPKRHGEFRLMEAPKPLLREMQRRILSEILDPVPAHAAVHGFRSGHSCLTYAAPHAGRKVVLRMDLRNFFPSIPARRIDALFRKLGYPEGAARVLTGLCTSRVPTRILQKGNSGFHERQQLRFAHLPQGAPTSPALSNLCALHLDMRLAALAESVGGTYTRYADDLAFSGDERFRRQAEKVSVLVGAIAREEGFEVNHRKTRIMHAGDRQMLTGIVVNEKPNIRRDRYDQLKAILHNCVASGPASQNRAKHRDFRAHLAGRVEHVKSLNRERGLKLQGILQRIDWGP